MQSNLNQKSFKLREIANWQLSGQNNILLPSMQRGFVWKPKQVEDIWDSLFRGFPIGSFLLSESEKADTYDLIDGQQRATSISLGFYNPYKENNNLNFWSIKNKVPSLWMDLQNGDGDLDRKYIVRIVTHSHPWGYERKSNNNKLSLPDRREALKIFNNISNTKNYTQIDSKEVFPYDAYLPVPLSFILNFDLSYDEWKNELVKNVKTLVPRNIKTKYVKFVDHENFILQIQNKNLKDLYGRIQILKDYKIHCNVVKKSILLEDEKDNPTLFVRLNSAGTVLNGDELIYSIYKAHFPEAKDLVENIGGNFVPPPVIVSIASRIALSEINEGQYPFKLTVRDFLLKIKDDKFRGQLQDLISKNLNSIFESAFQLLSLSNEMNFDRNLHKQIPNTLIKQLLLKDQELLLMLIYWIYKNPHSHINKVHHFAKLTILSWFCLDAKSFVRKNWAKLKSSDFWSLKLDLKENYFVKIINPKFLRNYYNENILSDNHNFNSKVRSAEPIYTYLKKMSSVDINDEQLNNLWLSFISRLYSLKSLLLYIQREYINSQFFDFNQLDILEDTDAPWDYDHIYPTSWVYRIKSFRSSRIDIWEYTIGNIRLLSLEENRSEGDRLSPKDRLSIDSIRKISFIDESNWQHWQLIDKKIEKEELVVNHTRAIVYRLLKMYSIWWDELEIESIIDTDTEINIEKQLTEEFNN